MSVFFTSCPFVNRYQSINQPINQSARNTHSDKNVDISIAKGILMFIWGEGRGLAPACRLFFYPSTFIHPFDVSIAKDILRFTSVDVSIA